MRYLEEKKSNVSTLIENQFPFFVQQNNPKFIEFLASYYESLENKYQPLDIASNLIQYYNIGYYRPNQLVEKTKLIGNLLADSTEIEVNNTTGFPDKNGYIQIDNEIVYYTHVDGNKFVGCVRGTTALVLSNAPKSEITLTNSKSDEHRNGSDVINISYAYANEFFSRIKSEIAPLITENVVSDLEYSQFLKNIKSFYSAKGSLNGHRIIFKILFNDKKYNVLLKPGGSGAKIKINNYNKYIPKDPTPEIVSGGTGYDNRRDPLTSEFLNSPVIDIFGSGEGELNSAGLRPNSTAVIKVTGIDSNGSITSIEVTDSGEGYIGPITSRIRNRSFYQDQRVYNTSGTGSGRVEYWDGYRNELVLYDVIGYFSSDDEIVGVGGEEPRSIVARAFIGTTSIRSGVETIPEVQNIEFPRDYTFKTSNSRIFEKKVIKCKILSGEFSVYGELPTVLDIVQDPDPLFGVKGVNIEVDNIIPLRDSTYEFEVSSNLDINDLYLPPSTEIIKDEDSSVDNFVITVDDASRFPVSDGIVSINGVLVIYKHRSINQFFDCSYYYSGTSTDITIGTKVNSWGRKKYTVEWDINQPINKGEFRYYKNNLYRATNFGITGTLNGPTHTSGVERDGSYADGNEEPVSWEYIGSNLYQHAPYVKSTNSLIEDTVLELLALPGEVVIVDGGSLHTTQQYEFATLKSPNTQTFNFTTKEISDRLAIVLSSNFNRSGTSVSDDRIPSFKSFVGFNAIYDYDQYVYVPSSAIPRWWNEIVDFNQTTLSDNDLKKVSFTNQKLISRYKKSTFFDSAKVVTQTVPTKQAIAINADAIQINSYKGSTINYGYINNFVIGDGGDYKVPITTSNNVDFFDYNKFPSFVINSNVSSLEISNQNKLIKISSKFTNIDFNKLAEFWQSTGELSGFTTKPVIEVVNNNPRKSTSISRSTIVVTYVDNEVSSSTFTADFFTDEIPFETADKVTYINALPGVIPQLTNQGEYYVRKLQESVSGNITTVTYSLHRSNSDSIIGINPISLEYINDLGDFSFLLLGEILNPLDFQQAEFDLSYNENTGTIDNIIVRNSGNGYVEAPVIRILGGGKSEISEITIPYNINGVEIIEMRGKLTSFTNFYKENFYDIDTFTTIEETFDIAPKVSVDSGSGAEASVYIANGSIVSVVLVRRGKNYYTKPSVKIIGNGKNAVIDAIIQNGEVVGFNIVNPGTGYTLPPRIEIVPSGTGSVISSRLNEWTFNLVERLSKIDRIDSFGGYVYNESDYDSADQDNILGLKIIDPEEDLPPSIDDRQYLILNQTEKLLAKYTIEQRKGYLDILYPGEVFSYDTEQEIDNVLSKNIHSPVTCVSYDGTPIYGRNGHSIRFDITSPLQEIESRYKLKYSTTYTPGSISYIISGTTYYFNRIGGPSIEDYPIGSFIEDYEFVAGLENDLDVHNGRFCVTPEYPNGRYCYFATHKSFDEVTNEVIQQSGYDFSGFPYFIGETYSSEPDSYPNKACRTNDKIPNFFTRAFDKEIPAFEIPGVFKFDGLPENERYPRENINYDRTILKSQSLSPGTVDSVIIESAGKNYKVGDSVIVDNTLTFGTGFGAFVSKVTGRQILNVFISDDKQSVTSFVDGFHGLSVGDYIYFDYTTPLNPVSINLHLSAFSPVSPKLKETDNISVLFDENAVTKYSNKKFFSLSLNSKYRYKLNIPNLPYTFTLDVDKSNEFFVLEEPQYASDPTTIVFDASTLPNILYLHIGDYIYEITTGNEYAGEYRVQSIDNSVNSFTVTVTDDTSDFETFNLTYSAKSKGAIGGVAEISVSSKGSNYRKLPLLEVVSDLTGGTGSGAIIQANSSTIGKIRNVTYLTAGGGFISNDTINHYLDIPSTAKIINNFEIYEVEVVESGQEYNDVLQILVNGKPDLAEFKINRQLGLITSVEVIDGGSNFETIPTLQVVSSTGTGCVLRAKIRRKQVLPGQQLIGNINSLVFPVQVNSTVVNFDPLSSTLEFNESTGSFKENDLLYTEDGRKYGRIISIRRPKAYAKVNSHTSLQSSRTDISGNSSEFLQKITDSNIYQDWSYILSSSRDTVEWRDQVEVNTHPAGHNLFGKKVIERRKFFFDRPEDVFKTSVIFTANLVNDILLKVKLSPCKDQVIAISNPQDFNIGDYIFGSVSEAIAEVVEINEYSLKVNLRNDIRFVVGEIIVVVPRSFSFGIESATFKSLAFWNGIMQEPELSYETTFDYFDEFGDPLSVPIVGTLIPKFELSETDELVHFKLSSGVQFLDPLELGENESLYYPSINGAFYDISSDFLSKTIISISGAVQDPDDLEVNDIENYVKLLDTPNYKSKLFAITSESLNKLLFSGNTSSDTFEINYSPDSPCELLIFYKGVNQTHLLTDFTVSGNIVTFSETVELSNIFGWYLDQTVDCEVIDVLDLLSNKVTGTWGCDTKNFTEFIQSSAVRNQTSLYEQRKEYLDGTIYPDPDNTTLFGFDTKFTYTTPEYSRSFVEVLDTIQFTGVDKSFKLTAINGNPYTPVRSEDSLMVYVDNVVLDPDEYTISGDTIVFKNVYSSSSKCTIIDFNSTYRADSVGLGGANLDRLDVQHNGTRKRFNLSDRGVPQYTKNVGDVFAIRNGVLQRPDKRHQTILENKITFNEAPDFNDTTDLVYFNRQLLPLPTKNIVLDDFYCFDGIRKDFPLTIDGVKLYPVNIYNLFVVRNGVYQKPGIDFRLASTLDVREVPGLDSYNLDGSHLILNTAPTENDEIIVFYSYNGLNQNLKLDPLRYFNGIETTFPLTVDYISTTPFSADHIQVYRNSVYQYSGVDYTVETTNGGPRIIFTTAPLETDDIFVTQYNTSVNFVNKTIDFVNVDDFNIENQTNELVTDSDIVLIYKSGILISDGWSIDYGTQVITFEEPFTVDSYTRIFVVKNCEGQLDKFFKFDGIETTFPLTKDIVSRVPYSDNHIQVYRNGVYQYSGLDYTVETTNGGPRIVFSSSPLETDKIFITNFHSNSHFVDATNDFTQTSSTTFEYSSTIGSNFLLIFVDGIIQLEDSYTVNYSTNVITFSQPVITSKIRIYLIGNQVNRLDTFHILDGINTTFPLSYFYDSVVTNNIHVYRNGVYQYPVSDYTLLNNLNGDRLINFATAPTLNDNIFIVESTNSTNYEDITNNFVQDNSTTLGNISTLSPSRILLIYNQGILQNSNSYSYNYTTNKLEFSETFILNSLVKIYSVEKTVIDSQTIPNGVLDSYYSVDGTTDTFPLTVDDTSYTTASYGNGFPVVQVVRNGVFQTEGYSTSNINGGPRIIFDTAPQTTENIFITAFGEDEFVELEENPTTGLVATNSTTITYNGSRNLSSGVVLIFREGVLQNLSSYTQLSNVFTFSESISLSNTKFYHLENTSIIDSPYFKDGVTTTFPLTKNNQSLDSITYDFNLVYRNGVYQYYGTDYTVSDVGGGTRIVFTTAPQSSESIFIQNFSTPGGFVDLTTDFTAVTPTRYQYNGVLSNEPLLVFVSGIMQVRDSWSYDRVTEEIVFTELPNGVVNIFQIKNCPILVNQLITESSQKSYKLFNGRKQHFPISSESLFVCIDGIVQKAGESYSVNGSELVFANDLTPGVPLIVIDASSAGLQVLDDVETAWEDGEYKYIRTLENYQSVNSPNILLSINGIIQDPNNYSVNNSVLSIFDQPQNEWNVIEIFNSTQSNFVRIDNLGTLRDIEPSKLSMVMLDNYWTIAEDASSLIVNLEGVVQNSAESYTTNGTLITFNSLNFDPAKTEIINVSSSSPRILDRLSDLYDEFVDESGRTHKEFILRNIHPELTLSSGVFVVYGSVVQHPGVDYIVHNNPTRTIEIISEYEVDLSQLTIYDVSKTSYELIDDLSSLIYSNQDNYTLRITKNYNTISGLSNEETLVQINGIVQKVSSYNIINSTITLIGSNYETAIIYDLSGANFRLVDHLSEDFSTPTYRLTQNYSTFTPSNLVDIFLLRDTVLQNPVEDYTAGSGYITFSTNIEKETDLFILYTHNSEEIIPIVPIPYTICTGQDTYTLPYSFSDEEKLRLILYLNGVPNFYGKDFLIDGTTLSFLGGGYIDDGTTAFIIKYTNMLFVDDLENCPDGTETKFKLLYQGKNILAESSADILTSRHGVVQNPDVDYVVATEIINGQSIAKYITFATPLPKDHDTFFVRMYKNLSVSLTQLSSTQYQVTNTILDSDNIYVFANGNWMLPTKDYTFTSGIINLQVPASDVFAIEFTGVVKLLDEVHTPYDSTRNTFNMFLSEENFVPLGTIEDDTNADETSILIIKNGKVLDPKVDYTLSGDIRSQITFQTAPTPEDIIMVKSVGSFKKLNTITSGFTGSTKTYNLTTGNPSTNYYPNAHIERPRDYENQILVIKDGNIQSPVYDYYIDNDKLVFNSNVSASTGKLVIMDFRGTTEDVHVDNRLNQINVGDKISLDCAIDEERTFVIDRTVTEILSPTVLKTSPSTQTIFANFDGSVVYNGGKVTAFTVSDGGIGYSYPAVLRTKGSGGDAKGVAQIDLYDGGRIMDGFVDVQYPGYNIYMPQQVVPTVYAFTYRNTQLTTSNLTKATALTADISDTIDVIPVIKTDIFQTNPPQVQITSPTGSGAEFIPYVINGYLRKLKIVSGGIGYDERYIQVEVVGGGGSGAVLEPVLDAFGTITDMIIRNPGVGYDSFRAFINSEAIEYTTKTNTELLGVTRNVLNYGLNPNEFPLIKNEMFITVHSVHNLQVFRNGVHQIPGVDFYTIPIQSGCDKIYFTTPVALGPSDDIFITHFDSSTDFTDISSAFTQVDSTTIQHTGTLTYDYLLMFIDGVVQLQDAWSFDSLTNSIIFDQPVDISTQSVLIYKISSPVNVLDTFTMTSSNTYSLSSPVTSAESIMVIIDGVVQQPFISYTTSGTDINFANVSIGSVVNVIDFSSVNYGLLDNIKVSRWINTSTCAIGHKEDDRVYSGTYL